MKKALRNDPPATEPKLNLKKRETGVQQFDYLPSLTYHYVAFPEIKKLTVLINFYMYLSKIAFPK